MDKKTRDALEKVLGYLWHDEQKHFESDPQVNHIYLELKAIRDAFNFSTVDFPDEEV